MILPIIFPILHANSQHHWNATVNNLTSNVLKIFVDMDRFLVEECQKRHQEEEKRKEQVLEKKKGAWQRQCAPSQARPLTLPAQLCGPAWPSVRQRQKPRPEL